MATFFSSFLSAVLPVSGRSGPEDPLIIKGFSLPFRNGVFSRIVFGGDALLYAPLLGLQTDGSPYFRLKGIISRHNSMRSPDNFRSIPSDVSVSALFYIFSPRDGSSGETSVSRTEFSGSCIFAGTVVPFLFPSGAFSANTRSTE